MGSIKSVSKKDDFSLSVNVNDNKLYINNVLYIGFKCENSYHYDNSTESVLPTYKKIFVIDTIVVNENNLDIDDNTVSHLIDSSYNLVDVKELLKHNTSKIKQFSRNGKITGEYKVMDYEKEKKEYDLTKSKNKNPILKFFSKIKKLLS